MVEDAGKVINRVAGGNVCVDKSVAVTVNVDHLTFVVVEIDTNAEAV